MERQYMFGVELLQNRVRDIKDAVMFDIDDTLISVSGKPLELMIDLLKEALDLEYFVIVMTARPISQDNVQWTIEQMKSLDIPYTQLFFVPAEFKGDAKIKSGYNYVLSLGDMPTDLTETEHWINTSDGTYA